jgi:transposase InsO family protein
VEAGAFRPVAQRKKAKRKKRKVRRRFNADEKRSTVEAYHQSGRSRVDFAALWGISPYTLARWLQIYEAEGPKGFEPKPRKRRGDGDPRRLSQGVRSEIQRTKKRFPTFGMRKVRDFLARFLGIRVSLGSVHRTLHDAGMADPPVRPKRRRKKSLPRRFERAKPGELWQSDITSYVLRRHSTRVYLTVFLDDFSRYVVSWQLATQQRGTLVSDALLEGIARYGKPQEVLTDQGRQYFAWRGKSAFQKLLIREGIRHVVSRTHHPQTLGKCERLWKTVADEFWERVQPQDLADARERLSHYFRHYNHFRPHQGIEGLVPADRFFGAEVVLRETLEKQLAQNELQLALEEEPRKPVFLFGQIGDRAVSLHGERGKLVIQTDEGGRQEVSLDQLGMAQQANERNEKLDDAGTRNGCEDGIDDAGNGGQASAQTHGAQAPELPALAPARPFGAGILDASERRGAIEVPSAMHGHPGVLAGPGDEGGNRIAPGDPCTARVAALPAGPVGDARGPLAASATPSEAGCGLRAPHDRHHQPQAENRGTGEEAGTYGRLGAGAEAPAVADGGWEWSPSEEAHPDQEEGRQEVRGVESDDERSVGGSHGNDERVN